MDINKAVILPNSFKSDVIFPIDEMKIEEASLTVIEFVVDVWRHKSWGEISEQSH